MADSYARGARILSVGIATTGVVTFAYFAVASHVLDAVEYKGVSLLWSVMFVIVSVIYRPIEQLLSRSIAERRALGHAAHSLRTPLTLQGAFALVFLAIALALRSYLEDDVFDGSATLYWVLVGAVLAYAASGEVGSGPAAGAPRARRPSAHGTTTSDTSGAARIPSATTSCPSAIPMATASGKRKREHDSSRTSPP